MFTIHARLLVLLCLVATLLPTTGWSKTRPLDCVNKSGDQPDLYVLVVGINHYAKGAGVSGLEYGVNDAKELAILFDRRAKNLYRKVHLASLSDDKATHTGILEAIATITKKARPKDTFVFYVAAHGYLIGQQYYLIPHDLPDTKGLKLTEVVQRSGLAIEKLGEKVMELPTEKRVLIFDTSYSGGALAWFKGKKGVFCLAATTADGLIAESKELGHGILAYSLLAGMGAVDKGPLKGNLLKSRDGEQVEVLEWFRYARDRVPGLYERYTGRPQQVELSGEDQPTFPLLAFETK